MLEGCGSTAARPGASALETARLFPSILFGLLLTWHTRARQRQALASLDDRMLRDIGISRAEALAEAAKPFWRR